jgi:hypothetical protein
MLQPSKDALPYSELPEVDRYTLSKLAQVMDDVRESYDKYQFYRFYQLVQRFMVVDLSNFYFDICKYVHVCYSFLRNVCFALTWRLRIGREDVDYSLPARAAVHGHGPVQLLLRHLQVSQCLSFFHCVCLTLTWCF